MNRWCTPKPLVPNGDDRFTCSVSLGLERHVRVFQEAISFTSLEKGGSTSLVRGFLHSRTAADPPAGITQPFLACVLNNTACQVALLLSI